MRKGRDVRWGAKAVVALNPFPINKTLPYHRAALKDGRSETRCSGSSKVVC
jgi:hypothetical protein